MRRQNKTRMYEPIRNYSPFTKSTYATRELLVAPAVVFHGRHQPLPEKIVKRGIMLSRWPIAWRSLRRRPAVFAATLLILALGIAANTAVFSVVDATLLKPLPYVN